MDFVLANSQLRVFSYRHSLAVEFWSDRNLIFGRVGIMKPGGISCQLISRQYEQYPKEHQKKNEFDTPPWFLVGYNGWTWVVLKMGNRWFQYYRGTYWMIWGVPHFRKPSM